MKDVRQINIGDDSNLRTAIQIFSLSSFFSLIYLASRDITRVKYLR